MDFGETLTAITAIVVGCWMLVQLFKYGARAIQSLFGPSVGGGGAGRDASLKAGEVEGMIRRAVREEMRQEVQPLREKIERLEQHGAGRGAGGEAGGMHRFHDLTEDPHDFGLIAGAGDAREEHAA